ncbi:nucleotide-binding universal stress UspA family protein [Salibacterium salarium]|uniref:hypothetical protein n=1 Tax=Salibacterium salarium TaxID=284579 RepID=UPI00277F6E30|nr:hypothetical protein [Salibacterium salarium]MDQ0299549.1 nucleotide-binding universal stress UspA family protein [Salibacterium salarium]
MQVSTYLPSKQTQESSFRLQEGGVYRARVLERRNSNEAVLGMRSGKMKAVFEGSMPKQNQVDFQVMGKKEGIAQVRAMSSSATNNGSGKAVNTNSILKNLGIQQPSATMTNAAKVMLDTGSPLTKFSAESMQRFIDSSNGTNEQKLNTIKTAATKGVDINDSNLKNIHEGLNSKSSVDFINDLSSKSESSSKTGNAALDGAVKKAIKAAEADSSQSLKEAVQDVRKRLNDGGSVEEATKAIKNRVMNHPDLSKEDAAKIEKAVKEAEHLTSTGKERLDRALQSVVSKEKANHSRADVEKALQQLRSQLNSGGAAEKSVQQVREALTSANVDKESAKAIENQLKEVEQLLKQGDRSAARNQLDRMLTQSSSSSSSSSKPSDLVQIINQIRNNGGSTEAIQQQIKQLLHASGVNGEDEQRILKLVKQLDQLDQAGKQRLMNTLTQAMNEKAAVANQGSQASNVQNMISSLQNQLHTEPNVETLINQIQKQLPASLPENVQKSAAEQMEKANTLLNEGKEMAARQTVQQSLQELSDVLSKNGAVSASAAQYNANEQIQTSPPFETKQMLETRITDRILKVTDEFKQVRQNTVKQLQQAEKIINQQSAPQAKQVLEATIKQMDRAILRSDFMLFTDMKTERKMMQASSQLAEAKQLLSKGQTSAALNIVKEVQRSMEQLDFKPSEEKVKNVITREATSSADKGVKAASQQVTDQARTVTQDPSSRQVFELVRSLGLNRESEIGQMFASSGKEQQGQSGSQQQNMKEALLQLLKTEDEGSRMQQKANQSVSNLTGQQLMSKSEQGNNMQHLLFNLPVPMKDKHEQLQVYVQSRQEVDQLDWENCNLYFLIDTPTLGETGIMVQSTERQLSITLKNDDPDFKEMMEPLVDQTTEAISEIGYNINDINYQPMSANAETVEEIDEIQEETEQGFLPFYTEKGFDYKI